MQRSFASYIFFGAGSHSKFFVGNPDYNTYPNSYGNADTCSACPYECKHERPLRCRRQWYDLYGLELWALLQ
jgi:hypothetical protein